MHIQTNYDRCKYVYFIGAVIYLGLPLGYFASSDIFWLNSAKTFFLISTFLAVASILVGCSLFFRHFQLTIHNVSNNLKYYYQIGDYLQSKGFCRSTEIRNTYVKFVRKYQFLPLYNQLYIHLLEDRIIIMGQQQILIDLEKWFNLENNHLLTPSPARSWLVNFSRIRKKAKY